MSLLSDFKAFAMKGNVVDMAVGVVVGGAFSKIVSSLVNDDEASGHLLIDECLALLFVVYIDPAFGVYLLERVDELLSGGFTVSYHRHGSNPPESHLGL